METLIFALYLFFDLIYIFVILDVIVSWLSLTGYSLRPQFIADILDPLYQKIRNIIPTTFGVLDFTAIILLVIISFIQVFLYSLNPNVVGIFQILSNISL